MWFKGEIISVKQLIKGAKDAYNNAIKEYEDPIQIDNVLVSPTTNSAIEEGMPDSISVFFSLYIKKADIGINWEGAKVQLRGIELSVIGRPELYSDTVGGSEYALKVQVGTYE